MLAFKSRSLRNLIFLAAVYGCRIASAQDILVDQDAYVKKNVPDGNFGSTNTLYVRTQVTHETFLEFDLTGIEGNITSATLSLFVWQVPGEGQIELAGSEEMWIEQHLFCNFGHPVQAG